MCPTGTGSVLLLHGEPAAARPPLLSAFEVLDADRDGKISRNDLRTFYTDYSIAGLPSEVDVIGTMMSVADLNQDGFVEYDEFEKVVDSGDAKRNGVMEDVFRVMDRDGDGRVGHQDLKAYLKWAGLPADDEDVKAMIKLGGGDDNGGGVTFHGFCKILCL